MLIKGSLSPFLALFWKSQKHTVIIGSWTIMVLLCSAVLDKWLKPIRKWGWLTMARMDTDCDMDFWKSVRMSVFQRFKFNLNIVQILPKWCCSVDVLQEIDPLHDPVTWYGINYTGTQVTQWNFQNKGNRTSPARLSFVLKVPLRNLHPSVIYSVPCDRIVQRA